MNDPRNKFPLTVIQAQVRLIAFACMAAALAGCQTGSSTRAHSLFAPAANRDVERGQQSLAQGDLKSAQRRFERANRCDSASAPAQAGLGQVAEKQGRLDDAIDHFRAALKIAPETSAYAVALGDCLRKLAMTSLERTSILESSARAYRHALVLNPNDFVAMIGLAQCYQQQGEFDRAVEALRHATRIDASSAQAHVLLAGVFESQQRFDAAIDEYKIALKLDPDDANVHNRLAALHLTMARSGRQNVALARERAVAHFRRSLQLNVNQPDIRNSLSKLQGVEQEAVTKAPSQD